MTTSVPAHHLAAFQIIARNSGLDIGEPATGRGAQSALGYRNLYTHAKAVKTTLNLNDALLTKAKMLAAQQHVSLTRLIEEGLQLRLKAGARPRRSARLPVHHGTGALVPGVNGLSNRSMLEAADE